MNTTNEVKNMLSVLKTDASSNQEVKNMNVTEQLKEILENGEISLLELNEMQALINIAISNWGSDPDTPYSII